MISAAWSAGAVLAQKGAGCSPHPGGAQPQSRLLLAHDLGKLLPACLSLCVKAGEQQSGAGHAVCLSQWIFERDFDFHLCPQRESSLLAPVMAASFGSQVCG